MKSLLIAFLITLSALCASLACIHEWQKAKREMGESLHAAELQGYLLQNFDPSTDPEYLKAHEEEWHKELMRDRERYRVAFLDEAAGWRERAEDYRQLSLSSGGVAIIGILALAFRGRQLWNSTAPDDHG